MMRFHIKISLIFFFVFLIFFIIKTPAQAVDFAPTPMACNGVAGCPSGTTEDQNNSITTAVNGACVQTYQEWQTNPIGYHYWATDLEVTNQGKANDRARQFIYWVLDPTKNSIDDHPVIKSIWSTTRNIAMIMLIVVAAIMGLGMIVSGKTNFNLKIPVLPSIFKLLALLIYINLSILMVIGTIQFSNYLSNTFVNALGGKDLFRIYFGNISDTPAQTVTAGTGQAGTSETNYRSFVGCRDLNWTVQESANTALFMMKATNFTYYAMGTVLIFRKIVLWFFIFVAPFLAVLLPFVLIRNVGYIWIGTFFQWVFYGPLFSLFLGALATIWKSGIPFAFDFSRADKPEGYIFPTGINILYGGPGQTLGFLNNSNYIDTFIQYAITVIMLWAVIILPWWLLRIFRDYCCDGIHAMKNILISLYDQMRSKPQTPPISVIPSLSASLNISKGIEIPVKLKLQNLEDIKRVNTEDISKSLSLKAANLSDIVRLESARETQSMVRRNLEYLANPNKAETPSERQKFMNIRTELFSRAVKEDQTAKQILSTIFTSKADAVKRGEAIIQTIPQTVPITNAVSIKVNLPQDKVSSLNRSFFSAVSANTGIMDNLSRSTSISSPQIQSILSSYINNLDTPPNKIIEKITSDTGIGQDKIVQVIKDISEILKANEDLISEIAQKENLKPEDVKKIIATQLPIVTEPEKNIEALIPIPPNVSIEEYEDVKKMWQEQYEKGEVPVSEHIKSRTEWLDKDIVFITNTLNKLLSSDTNLKHEGLNNLGYVLPIFIINNIKGEELLVYLKAKLEAAKSVKNQIEKEKEIKEKLQKDSEENQEELVDVDRRKTEEKTKEQAMEIEEENKS